MKSLLALDLGTQCGYALGGQGRLITGTWELSPGRYEGGGMRFVKFRTCLNKLLEADAFDMAVFEEVRRHRGTDAAHIYGGLMGTFTAWCEERKIPYKGIPVQSIKKYATGRGNADKTSVKMAVTGWGYSPRDDNEADAIALWHCVWNES